MQLIWVDWLKIIPWKVFAIDAINFTTSNKENSPCWQTGSQTCQWLSSCCRRPTFAQKAQTLGQSWRAFTQLFLNSTAIKTPTIRGPDVYKVSRGREAPQSLLLWRVQTWRQWRHQWWRPRAWTRTREQHKPRSNQISVSVYHIYAINLIGMAIRTMMMCRSQMKTQITFSLMIFIPSTQSASNFWRVPEPP